MQSIIQGNININTKQQCLFWLLTCRWPAVGYFYVNLQVESTLTLVFKPSTAVGSFEDESFIISSSSCHGLALIEWISKNLFRHTKQPSHRTQRTYKSKNVRHGQYIMYTSRIVIVIADNTTKLKWKMPWVQNCMRTIFWVCFHYTWLTCFQNI